MDNLVLIRVAAALDSALERSALVRVHDEPPARLRLVFETRDRPVTVALSVDPERPWLGRPFLRREVGKRTPGPFAALLQKTLGSLLVSTVEKPHAERVVRFRFAGGPSLVAELLPHRPNLVLLDADERVLGSARRTRSAQRRLATGERFVPLPSPDDAFDPFRADAQALAERLRDEARPLFGVARSGMSLASEEARASGRPLAVVLHERLAALTAGEADPGIECDVDPRTLAERGPLAPGTMTLWPWPPAGGQVHRSADAALTVGLYHDLLDRSTRLAERGRGLRRLLEREIRRMRSAQQQAAADLERFGDPDRLRRYGEALLAGIGRERRVGEAMMVPDPYDAGGGDVAVPVRPGQTIQEAAEAHFSAHRRARRGLERARERLERVAGRRSRLESLLAGCGEEDDGGALEALEEAMRREGMPVGLAPPTRAGRAGAAARPPRLEGVRMFTSSDGLPILVGRTGRDNQRLTFKLAGPEDFWFHAQDVPGAHVVVSNADRRSSLPRSTIVEAAAAAAWWSDARRERMADVQWTRRKNVRRPRGAAPGTVVLKRFETVRVRPRAPAGEEGGG